MELWPRIAEALITPPGIVVLLLFLTFLAYLRRQWLGAAMLVLSTIILVALSLPLTAQQQMNGLQNFSKPPELVPLAEKGPKASLYAPKNSLNDLPEAIVVLGHGRYAEAPEYDLEDTVNAQGLERLRYAAFLQRKTGLPILVSGGAPGGEDTAEAEHMQAALTADFHANVKWVERESRTTMENARYSQVLLAPAKVRHIYLVTHAWHMRRAARAFESVGIKVTPAPTGFYTLNRAARMLGAYLPSAQGMYFTSIALRERLAFIGYGFKENDVPANGKPSAETALPPESTPAAASGPAPKKK
ncbi:MAG: YdcF family protein [Pseudomonadota bacterium]